MRRIFNLEMSRRPRTPFPSKAHRESMAALFVEKSAGEVFNNHAFSALEPHHQREVDRIIDAWAKVPFDKDKTIRVYLEPRSHWTYWMAACLMVKRDWWISGHYKLVACYMEDGVRYTLVIDGNRSWNDMPAFKERP
jgi:hypothetical protein